MVCGFMFFLITMANIQAFQKSTSKFLIHPLLWRLTGFVSSIVGFTCYAFSSSFQNMFGQWSQVKIIVYSVVSSLLCISMLLVKRCSGRHGRSLLLKAQLGFVVLAVTSLWSFLQDHSEEGKVGNSYSKRMNLTSTGAFALMAISLSRQLQLGLDVGVTNFFVGCFLVTVMKMNLKLAPLAAFFCYLLVNIRSISDFLLKLRAHEPCFDPLKYYEKFPEGEKFTQRDEMVRKIVHTHLVSLCISLLLEVSSKQSTQHADDDKVEKNLMHHRANSEIYIDMPKFQGPEANSDDVVARDANKANSDVFVYDTDEANFEDLEAYSDDFAHDTVADIKIFINKESEESKKSK